MIAKTAKYIWTSSEINLVDWLSPKHIIFRTWQEHWFVNRSFNCPGQCASKIIQTYFSVHLTRKPTNLEKRYLIQVIESLIFTNLEIYIFYAVQEYLTLLIEPLGRSNSIEINRTNEFDYFDNTKNLWVRVRLRSISELFEHNRTQTNTIKKSLIHKTTTKKLNSLYE